MSVLRFLCVSCGRTVKQDQTAWVHDQDHTPACPPPSSHDAPGLVLRCPHCHHTITVWQEHPTLLDVEAALDAHDCPDVA